MNFFLFNLTFDINVSEVKSATNNNEGSVICENVTNC